MATKLTAIFATFDRLTRTYVATELPAQPCPGKDGRPCEGRRCLVCPGHGFVPSVRS